MIYLDNVHKVFNQGKVNEFQAIKGVNLTLEGGKISVLKGPSGSGKTTLLTMIGGLSRPTSGRVRLQDRDLSSLPERFLTEIRRKTFGFVFQQFNLIKGLSVLDNVMVPALPTGRDHKEVRDQAAALLGRLKIDHKSGARVEWLSGGEAQRVAIARALVNDPEIVIADEPTANLDSTLSEEFLEIIHGVKQEGRTVLMTSHDPVVCDAEVVDRVISMRDGALVDGQEA